MKIHLLKGIALAIAFVASNAIAGISGGALRASAAVQLLIVGPVEAIKERDGTATILGQKLPLRSLGPVEVGESVSVFGVLRADGSIMVSRVVLNGEYVPGSSPILLTAVVQKVSPAIGRAVVGGLNVDLNSLASLDQTISVGSVVQLAGTQPNPKGLILAQGVGSSAVQGISGGAVQGISGGAVQGISGGAVQGISGGAVQGISGGATS
jgi:hypothetical protein